MDRFKAEMKNDHTGYFSPRKDRDVKVDEFVKVKNERFNMLITNGTRPFWTKPKFYWLASILGCSSYVRRKVFRNSNPSIFKVTKRIEKISY